MKTIYIQDRAFDTLHDQTPALGEVRFYDATVDTFFTLAFLAQAKSAVNDPELAKRINSALKILQYKIETTQNLHGTWIDDTDPLAKINDTITKPPILFTIPPPQRNRVTPKNPRLPEDDMAKAALYDPEQKNILVHCQQLRDISFATRHGVEFKMTTRFKAENYLLKNFNENRWEAAGDGPYVKNVAPRAILLTSVVATWYQVHLTAAYLADKAQQAADAGEQVDPNVLGTLRQHVKETRAHLERQVNRFLAYNNVPWCGPALENLPDCLLAVELIRPGAGKGMQDYLAAKMLSRQRSDGNFIAGPNDDWRYYEWIGSDRGESIFGTATTLRLLMQMQKDNADPFAGEQAMPRGDPWGGAGLGNGPARSVIQTPSPDHPRN